MAKSAWLNRYQLTINGLKQRLIGRKFTPNDDESKVFIVTDVIDYEPADESVGIESTVAYIETMDVSQGERGPVVPFIVLNSGSVKRSDEGKTIGSIGCIWDETDQNDEVEPELIEAC